MLVITQFLVVITLDDRGLRKLHDYSKTRGHQVEFMGIPEQDMEYSSRL